MTLLFTDRCHKNWLMKTPIYYSLCCIYALLMIALPAGQAKSSEFALSLRCPRDTILVGEPLMIRVRILNRSGQERMLPVHDTGLVQILLGAKGSSLKPYRPLGTIDGASPLLTTDITSRLLRVNEEIEFDVVVLFATAPVFESGREWRHLVFPQAGGYQIAARLADGETQSINIKVVEPIGKDAVLGRELISLKAYPFFVQFPTARSELGQLDTVVTNHVQYVESLRQLSEATGGGLTDPPIARLRELVRINPDSPYSQHVALALARYHAGVTRDPVDAEKLFQMSVAMRQVPWVREIALLEWAQLATPDRAVYLCDLAIEEFPDNPYRRVFASLRVVSQAKVDQRARRPVDPIITVERELMNSGFDLTSLTAEERRRINEEVIAATWKECETKHWHTKDCDAELMKRYREWVGKNLRRTISPHKGESVP